MPKLSAVIIALNEARHVRECLESARFCDERVVVDSGSRDGTFEIAQAAGAKVWHRRFDDFASQKNFAIEKAAGDWLLLLDADERVPEALAGEIRSVIQNPKFAGYRIPRRNRIFGRWMGHGANRRDLPLRLVKKSAARLDGAVHERVTLAGPAGTLRHALDHFSTETISDYMRKLNHYTTLETLNFNEQTAPARLHTMKLKPFLRLCDLVACKRAFQDGTEGLLFAVLSAYYDFVSLAKHWEKTCQEK